MVTFKLDPYSLRFIDSQSLGSGVVSGCENTRFHVEYKGDVNNDGVQDTIALIAMGGHCNSTPTPAMENLALYELVEIQLSELRGPEPPTFQVYPISTINPFADKAVPYSLPSSSPFIGEGTLAGYSYKLGDRIVALRGGNGCHRRFPDGSGLTKRRCTVHK